MFWRGLVDLEDFGDVRIWSSCKVAVAECGVGELVERRCG